MFEPIIEGCVAKNCHPLGCEAAVESQIAYVKACPAYQAPKRVLVLGSSSGYGLAARISLAFGGGAKTLGVAYERGPTATSTGSAGWHNQMAFDRRAQAAGLSAESWFADAFLPSTQQQLVDWIRREWGQIDLLVYSLATGIRVLPDGRQYRSVLKSIGNPLEGWGLDLGAGQLIRQRMSAASVDEIADTEFVMGGEDWQRWIERLQQADALAPGFRTLAFSYEGPAFTHAWYRDGTLGQAKLNLQAAADRLQLGLAPLAGEARVVMCKALVTKASLVIPFLPVYLMLLMRVMKEKGLHEGCIEQMNRLFAGQTAPHRDSRGRLRLDDRELRADVQQDVLALWSILNAQNFRDIGDFAGLRQDFLQLNGFDWPQVDYARPWPSTNGA